MIESCSGGQTPPAVGRVQPARIVAPPINWPALAKIAAVTLADIAPYAHRLPEPLRRAVDITRADLYRALAPWPITYLPLPPETFRLGDGRELRLVDTSDLSAIAGRETVILFYAGPKHLGIGVSSDLTPHGRLLHASIAYPDRYPSWRDVREVREALYPPGVDVAMILPRPEDYVNVHPNCFQLWQIPIEWALR
jgi:hypothetical protein